MDEKKLSLFPRKALSASELKISKRLGDVVLQFSRRKALQVSRELLSKLLGLSKLLARRSSSFRGEVLQTSEEELSNFNGEARQASGEKITETFGEIISKLLRTSSLKFFGEALQTSGVKIFWSVRSSPNFLREAPQA